MITITGLLVAGSLSVTLPCTPAPRTLSADRVLARIATAMGVDSLDGQVLRLRARMVRELRDLSDRPSPPFDAAVSDEELWIDPVSGVERTMPLGPRGGVLWSGPAYTLSGTDSIRQASGPQHLLARWQRAFDPWAVVAEWRHQPGVTVEGRCEYRDYTRLVLRRRSSGGTEQLVIDETGWLPIALLREERSYFMGPEQVEYRYIDWERLGSALYPYSALRVVGGSRDRLRTALIGADGSLLVARDSAPPFPAPLAGLVMTDSVVPPPEPFWTAAPPDTVRIGPTSFLLVNASFTSALALAGDTVFILDAAQGEGRARQDSVWIARLFPGKHALAFVVATDIWPHIAGLRYWAANGATIIAHPVARPVVLRALARRWTSGPDLYERRRGSVRVRIDTVRTAQRRAGGALQVIPIDGAASEGVLGVYVRDDGFLWASDRVQDVEHPSRYVTELARAAVRHRLTPRWTSGPHLRAVPWSVVAALGGQ